MADALNNLGSDNLSEYLGMEVTNLSTGYNALTQSPVSATPTTQSYFHRPFDVALDQHFRSRKRCKMVSGR